jgi:hypothetical protein
MKKYFAILILVTPTVFAQTTYYSDANGMQAIQIKKISMVLVA